MADTYYYMWEFVTSMTIIILVAAYIIHDRIKLRYQKLDESRQAEKIKKLNGVTQVILGVLAALGGGAWILFMQTHEIYISPELRGFHNLVPAIIMSLIGVAVLAVGAKKLFAHEQ